VFTRRVTNEINVISFSRCKNSQLMVMHVCATFATQIERKYMWFSFNQVN
jgi:hypothetical protein